MPSIEYGLFRAKFIKPAQASFLHSRATPQQLFLHAIDERPEAELREGYKWHIGNIRRFSKVTGYFAVGRTTNATIEKFDDSSGDFVEEELETSPYTHCVFDAALGILGIARKPRLSPTTNGIAQQIQTLLQRTDAVTENNISVEIAPIPDPDGFVRAMQSAYRVTRFAATFRGPNPFDADRYFQKPLAKLLSDANGQKGKAELQGNDLDRDVLTEVARSTAATGNQASARIMSNKSQRPTTIHMAGDPVKRTYEEESHDPERVLADLTEMYDRVRENG